MGEQIILRALAFLTIQRSEGGEEKAVDQKIKSPASILCFSLGLTEVERSTRGNSGIRCVIERRVDGGVCLLVFSRASPQ